MVTAPVPHFLPTSPAPTSPAILSLPVLCWEDSASSRRTRWGGSRVRCRHHGVRSLCMRTHLSRLGLLACLFLSLRPAHAISAAAGDVQPTRGGPLTIQPLTHGSLLFQWRGRAIYVDPAGNYDGAALPKAH